MIIETVFSRMQMKKPAWTAMPALDMRVLSDAQVTSLAVAYDALCNWEFGDSAICRPASGGVAA